jgi:aspartate aminotransferase-like enzyme/GNAT superfamily N-acetyltransferase
VKIATEEWEFEAIHRLNYETFVDEIPQHHPDPSRRLVDRFHGENTYIVCVRGTELIGMVAARGNRPFSLHQKVPALDSFLPPGRRVCELRLLAIARPHRAGRVLHRLLGAAWRFCREQGYEFAVISATTRQLALYRHLGFVPFGSPVGPADARYQPMMALLEKPASARNLFRRPSQFERVAELVSLLPGPVPVHPEVRQALLEAPESHRSAGFEADLAFTRTLLCRLSRAQSVEILLGSGTLANDAIAGQLTRVEGPGLILSNGEFGERLVDHAARFGLACEVMRWPWGSPLDLVSIHGRLSRHPAPRWIWFAHLETSTGVLNDLGALTTMCRDANVRVCVDAVSAFGTVPLNLEDVYFASAVSGKGAGAFAGLAIVFYNHRIDGSGARLPRYIDLALYAQGGGVPFTHSSNLLRALATSLDRVDWDTRYRRLADTSRWLRARLRECGFALVAAEIDAAPGIVTIALPAGISSTEVDDKLRRQGYALAGSSEYLRERNWIQISVMAQPSIERLRPVIDALHRVCSAAAV